MLCTLTYAGMPNASGGAVVIDTATLAGIHTGTIWHLQAIEGVGSHQGVEPPTTPERDGSHLWDDDEPGLLSEAVTDDHLASQVAVANIPHKGTAGLFIPAMALRRFLRSLDLMPLEPLDAAAALGRLTRSRSKKQRSSSGATS